MNSSIAVHPKTNKSLLLILKAPAGSILVLGPDGSGKVVLSFEIIQKLIHSGGLNLNHYPYFRHIKKINEKKEISIDSVREISEFIKLKIPGSGIRRAVLIENAQFLSTEAQNALLKMLEEPHDDTVFLLTAPYELSLLPTIVSRCQKIKIYPVSLKQATSFYDGRFTPSALNSAWQLSQGRAALLDALVNDDKSHPLKISVEMAKQFVSLPKPSRLSLIDNLSREDMKQFLDALSRVVAALYASAQEKGRPISKQLLSDRKTIQVVTTAYELNANQRLANLKLLNGLNI